MQTKLAQSIPRSFDSSFSGSEVTITQVHKTNSSVVTCGRPERGRSATRPVSLKRLTRRSVSGANMNIEMPSKLLLHF